MEDVSPREYLFGLEQYGIKLGLETITYLLDASGRPQQAYPTVHVAGTNGKGSVVAFLSAILRAAGCRVGQFTSPHLIDLTERFQVDGAPICENALSENASYFKTIADGRQWWPPTFFEMNAAIAFRWFAQCGVDCGVIEVGLGGRFDATNVIVPEVSVIVTIDRDHMRFLGETLEEIAFEKAGIMKQTRPVVVGETKSAPRRVLLARAAELHCPVDVIDWDFRYAVSGTAMEPQFRFESDTLRFGPAPLGLAGKYQGQNAAVAVAAARRLMERFPRVNEQTIVTGLRTARWPCRLEKVLDDPVVIIDVAHNTAGAKRLAETLPQKYVMLLAVSNDKDVKGMLDALAPMADTFILTQFTGSRALPVAGLCAAAGAYAHRSAPTVMEAIAMGMDLASSERPLLITGSIFTAGEARSILVRDYGAPPLRF